MNVQSTLDQLQKLKLHGMAKAYETALSLPVHEQPTTDVLIGRLAEAESQYRINQKTVMYLKLSKLRYNAILEQVYCNASRNLTNDQLLTLADCRFIENAENILITGATGCGKSYIACALGRQACALGYKVMYFGMNRFLEKVAQTKLDGTFIKLLNQIEKTHLLVLDDFGLHPFDAITRLALLQILEDRYGKKSVIITSQLPVAKWYEFIGEPTLADAIMDRLAGNAHRLDLKGESLRKNKGKQSS
jgi:DNA replication protein DnaC